MVKSKTEPVSVTVLERLPELAVNTPATALVEVGVKTIAIVQLPPAARLLTQLLDEMLKGEAITNDGVASVVLPELVIVTTCATLATPTAVAKKLNEDGLALSLEVDGALPFSGTETAVTLEVDDETTSVAVFKPLAEGVKTTCAVQLAPLASNVAHTLGVTV